MHIDSKPQAVYALVTDYNELEQLSDIVIESQLLDSTGAEPKRQRVVTRVCILFFCFTSPLVEDVVEKANGTIVTTIVAALSDYRYGRSVWQVMVAGSGMTWEYIDIVDETTISLKVFAQNLGQRFALWNRYGYSYYDGQEELNFHVEYGYIPTDKYIVLPPSSITVKTIFGDSTP